MLSATLVDNFTPMSGHRFVVMTASSIAGNFATTNLPILGTDLDWRVKVGDTSVELRVTSPEDSDGDRIADTWELQHFPDLDATDGGQDDFDGDGFLDLHEFRARTLPNDPNSFLGIVQLRPHLTNQYEISWSGVTGKLYRVLYKTNLKSSAWIIDQSGVPGEATTNFISINVDHPKAFFSIDVE